MSHEPVTSLGAKPAKPLAFFGTTKSQLGCIVNHEDRVMGCSAFNCFGRMTAEDQFWAHSLVRKESVCRFQGGNIASLFDKAILGCSLH